MTLVREEPREGETHHSAPHISTTVSSATETQSSAYPNRQPVVLYTSISVDCQHPSSPSFLGGALQIVERDTGTDNDFWNIHVDFIWRPRGIGSRPDPEKEPNSHQLNVSIDHFLTLRLCLETTPPTATIHLHGGNLLGHFRFPNGPDAAMAFWTAMRERVDTLPLSDTFNPPQLFLLEKKPRMRRAVPSLAQPSSPAVRVEEDYSTLLQDLSLHDTESSSRRRPAVQNNSSNRIRQNPQPEDFGIMLLSRFAKVTQVAREIGEEISTLLDEKKRRADLERKQRERAARRRALDIYADIVASTDVERELPPRLTLDEKRGIPVSLEAWRDAFDEAGSLKDPIVMKQAIFSGGVEPILRSEVWPFLLGFYKWSSSGSERANVLRQKRLEYATLRGKWTSLQSAAKLEDAASLANDEQAITVDRRKRVSKLNADYLEAEEQITKDIIRTDRHLELYAKDGAPATIVMGALLNVYAIYDNRITYCQGMSDFLSPIIYVTGVENEALAFWCFESLMQRIECNFRLDQSGMRTQLAKLKKIVGLIDKDLAEFFEQSDPDYYCCFRWILVRFKRELPFEATAQMWEVLWTRQVGGDDLHIYVAAALLAAHRRQLLSLPRGAFDSLLRYVNDMSMRIDTDFALREGELCFRKYAALVR